MNKDAINRMLLAYYFPSIVVPRGKGNEAKRVNARLNGFDHANSNVYKCLRQKFGATVTHRELKSIAKIICLHTGLKLDRDATRDCRVLIKWFDENWQKCFLCRTVGTGFGNSIKWHEKGIFFLENREKI